MVVIVALAAHGSPVAAEDWSRFRGPNGAGVSTSRGLPVEFSKAKNVDWVVDVPFGRSSPAFAGDRIFVTATEGGKLVTLGLDRASGKVLWKQALERRETATLYHDNDSATPTPVSDGSNVYVLFHEFGLVSYDGAGRERWRHPLGPFRNFYGLAASPVVAGDRVLLVCDQSIGFLRPGPRQEHGAAALAHRPSDAPGKLRDAGPLPDGRRGPGARRLRLALRGRLRHRHG